MKGSIRRRGRDSFQLTIDVGRDSRGRRQRKYISARGSRADADRKLREAMSSLDQGLPIVTSKVSLQNFLAKWISAHSSRVRDRTIYGYGNVLKRYVYPRLGHVALTRLQPSHIEDLYASLLESHLSARTITQLHRILKKALKQAVRWNYIGRNPSDLVDPPRFEKREMIALDSDQLRLLLEAASRTPYGMPIFLAAFTGLRRGELVGLKWAGIDIKSRTIAVRREVVFVPGKGHLVTSPKSPKSRKVVNVSPVVIERLQEHLGAQAIQRQYAGEAWKHEGWVFTGPDGGHLDPNALSRIFLRLRKELSLPPVVLHSLRHSHATLLLQAKTPMKVVQERLGHSTIAITADIYSHVSETLQKQAAKDFDRIIGISDD